jgi:hypothetical protein
MLNPPATSAARSRSATWPIRATRLRAAHAPLPGEMFPVPERLLMAVLLYASSRGR